MTTDQTPSEGEAQRLIGHFKEVYLMVLVMIKYHERRANFFNLCDFILKSVNILLGVGVLVFIRFQATEKTDFVVGVEFSLFAAGITVLLLFFGMLFDPSKKEETHHWLLITYKGFNKEMSEINLANLHTLDEVEYEKYTELLRRVKEGMHSLRKTEGPLLDFEYYLSTVDATRGSEAEKEEQMEQQRLLFEKVRWWYFLGAKFFSMVGFRTKLIAQWNYEAKQQKQQQEQQQQEPNKDNKGKEEKAP